MSERHHRLAAALPQPTLPRVVDLGCGGGLTLAALRERLGAEVELIGVERREYRLRDALREGVGAYDFVVIDCPPALNMLTVNGFAAADAVIIPMQCEYYALEGLSDLVGSLR